MFVSYLLSYYLTKSSPEASGCIARVVDGLPMLSLIACLAVFSCLSNPQRQTSGSYWLLSLAGSLFAEELSSCV